MITTRSFVVTATAFAAALALSAAFAQNTNNAQGTKTATAAQSAPGSNAYGTAQYIDIGSTKETAAKKRIDGSFYKGAGVQTIIGKPHKLGTQEDEGGYALEPAPAKDKALPYDQHKMYGVWELIPASDISETVSSRVPPMTPEAKKKFLATRTGEGPRGVAKDQNDPEEICDADGWPRIVYQPIRPVEFLTLPDRILQHWAWHDVWRTIWTDGRLLPKDPDPSWWGYSTGKWVGEVFVADTNGVDGRTWLDRYGDPHSDDMEVQERWHRFDHNTMSLGITLKDPASYTETWDGDNIIFQLYPNLEVDSLPCAPSEELEYRDQIRSSYPDDADLHKSVKDGGNPTTIMPRVQSGNGIRDLETGK